MEPDDKRRNPFDVLPYDVGFKIYHFACETSNFVIPPVVSKQNERKTWDARLWKFYGLTQCYGLLRSEFRPIWLSNLEIVLEPDDIEYFLNEFLAGSKKGPAIFTPTESMLDLEPLLRHKIHCPSARFQIIPVYAWRKLRENDVKFCQLCASRAMSGRSSCNECCLSKKQMNDVKYYCEKKEQSDQHFGFGYKLLSDKNEAWTIAIPSLGSINVSRGSVEIVCRDGIINSHQSIEHIAAVVQSWDLRSLVGRTYFTCILSYHHQVSVKSDQCCGTRETKETITLDIGHPTHVETINYRL